MTALIDADSIIYRTGFVFEDITTWNSLEVELGLDTTPETSYSSDIQLAKNAIDALISNILLRTNCSDYELWLSGEDNFRYSILSTYKGNRVNARKPLDYKGLKDYLMTHYQANITYGCEADDVVVSLKTIRPLQYVLCAIDKDVLYQTEGIHYNYGKDEFINVTQEEAERFFWYQVLVGDNTDGYSGCRGVGKVKANRLLDEAEEVCKETNIPLVNSYASVVLRSYLDAGQPEEDFIKTCQVANMHQVKVKMSGFSLVLMNPMEYVIT